MRVCPICSSGYASVVYKTLSVWICNECGMIYSDAEPADYVNNSMYEEPTLYGNEKGQVEHYREQAERLKGWFGLDTRILDIGSATGGLLKALREAGFTNISGYDLSAKARENCRKMGFTMHSVLPTGQDVVVLSHVLEHVADVYDMLRKVRKCLWPGGMAYVEVPNVDGYYRLKGLTLPFNSEHINHFSRRSLKDAVVRSGLDFIVDGVGELPYCGESYPVLWNVSQKRMKPHFDCRFVARIERQTQEILDKVAARDKVSVWGLGGLAKLIFGHVTFANPNVAAATDSNPIYHGKTVFGVEVVPPEKFKPDPWTPIVVCTQLKIDEIVSRIKELGLPNELITFPAKDNYEGLGSNHRMQ